MKRFFNTTGLCNPEQHYMVDPFRDLYPDVSRLIANSQYFVLHNRGKTDKFPSPKGLIPQKIWVTQKSE
jgi:hypothetical protein